MAKVEKLGGKGIAVATAAAVFSTNWLSARYLEFPYAWCWGKPVIQPIVEPWLFLLNLVALGYLVACALKLDAVRIVSGLMVCIVVFGFPTFTEILFRLGKSCS